MLFILLVDLLVGLAIILLLPAVAILWVGAFTAIPGWLNITCLSVITFISLIILIGLLVSDRD